MPSEDTQFKPGNKMQHGKGRPSMLNDPTMCERVAEAFVNGLTRPVMAEMFGVEVRTITRWRRDPRVRAITHKLIEDRILQVVRKTDTEIERRLLKPEELSTKEIIEIRKEFLGGALRQQHEKADDETTAQAMEALEKNPELAAKMLELLSGTAEIVPAGEPDPVTSG